MTPSEFAAVSAYLSAAVGKPMPAAQLEVYYDLLGDLPADAVLAAAKQAVAESQYPTIPPVGVLRSLALVLIRGPELHWGEAWALTAAAVRRWSVERERQGLASLPPSARQAAEAIGWRALCDATSEDLGTLRAQFRQVYEPLAEREHRQALMPPTVRQAIGQLAGQLALPREGPECRTL